MKRILLLCLITISLGGCTVFGKSDRQVKNTVKRAEKASSNVEKKVRPPVKPWLLVKSEMDILAMALKDIKFAEDAMTRRELTLSLKRAGEKLSALQVSVGLSPKNIGKISLKRQDRILSKHRRMLSDSKKKEYEYLQRMRKFEIKASTFQDTIKEKNGIISQLTFWLIVAIVISVLIAAFVPGGMFFVKRFWGGAFKVAHLFGKKAYETLAQSIKGINKTMDKYPQFDKKMPNSDRTFREAIEDGIQMEITDEELLYDVKNGGNKLKELNDKLSKHIMKVR